MKKRKEGEAWQLWGNDPLERCQKVGVENATVGKDRRACGTTDNFSVFGGGYNGGIKITSWGFRIL